jgi:hypothetical protein
MPNLKEIQDSDTPEQRIRTALVALNQIQKLVNDHSILANNQSEILESLKKVIGDLNVALELLKKEPPKEPLND